MGYLGNLMTAARDGISAFRESMLNADPARGREMFDGGHGSWGAWGSRETRYGLNFAMYQNTAYRDLVHRFSARFKTAVGASKHIRPIYNPATQLCDFYAAHVWGGTLDREAGDGESEQSALPILTENEALRPAIARLRRDSKWQAQKDVCTLWGAAVGDAAIRVVDDPERGVVRKELVYAAHLADVDFDEQHNVKGYLIRKWMRDPRPSAGNGRASALDPNHRHKMALYTERCTRDGDLVVYETFIDEGKPYAWNGVRDQWAERYGFVPLVVIPHRSIGLDWGANCFHGSLPRFVEVDDQASCLGDNNRKQLHAPMYVAGAKAQKDIKQGGADRAARTPQQNASDPEPARTEMNFLYGPDGSTITPLTMPFDVAGVCEHIRSLLDGIEKKHPELLADTGMGGTVTAEAVRNARQIGGAIIQGIRPAYDDAEVRTNQMAVSIGGYRKYKGYDGFGLDSYEVGRLDHAIGHRPVFEVDPLDSIEEDQAFWTAAGAAVAAGVPLAIYLERNGWSEEELASLATAKQAEDAKALALAKATAPPGPGGNGKTSPGATK